MSSRPATFFSITDAPRTATGGRIVRLRFPPPGDLSARGVANLPRNRPKVRAPVVEQHVLSNPSEGRVDAERRLIEVSDGCAEVLDISFDSGIAEIAEVLSNPLCVASDTLRDFREPLVESNKLDMQPLLQVLELFKRFPVFQHEFSSFKPDLRNAELPNYTWCRHRPTRTRGKLAENNRQRARDSRDGEVSESMQKRRHRPISIPLLIRC